MVFTLVCFGSDRIYDTLHLLNDLRNINVTVYLLTDQEIDLTYYQFDNVFIIKTNSEYNDFERFKIIETAFIKNPNVNYVYHLDCDSRLFDMREEKFNINNFISLLDLKSFDIMCSWFIDPIKTHLEKPNPNENKDIRNNKYGFDSVIDFFHRNVPNYDLVIQNSIPLETVLIFKRSDKLFSFISDMHLISDIIVNEEKKIGRKIKVSGCGFAMGLLGQKHQLNIISDEIVYHFFKGNFIREVFPFNFKIDKNKKIFKE